MTIAGRDPGAFAQALGRMLDDDDLRSRMSTAARPFVARFEPSIVLDQFEAVYRPVTASDRLDEGQTEAVGVL